MDDEAKILAAIEELGRLYRGFAWESQVWARDGFRRSPYRALVLFGLSAQDKGPAAGGDVHPVLPTVPSSRRASPDGLLAGERTGVAGILCGAGQVAFVKSAIGAMALNGWQVPRDRERLMEHQGCGR